ncbi:hypothetical protein BU24DRAFT_422212 [Aaosphaeria arxii CBS 175.79]|uniref:Pre-mRNA-splicing factor n=1 Tax=Aaosphaeria arxii CBS 175.79 TaxID=1450172 RepID=A0A6A5XT93_9PLEO|nr:uncharacterized protein BU24DRAFT_422212 [Aaosphaeria arxii CBS 175.79]KAF2015900.1 hypothetical protein BU24DRAFT_422212 [Aaosphaeria arxii CBS 175.79]
MSQTGFKLSLSSSKNKDALKPKSKLGLSSSLAKNSTNSTSLAKRPRPSLLLDDGADNDADDATNSQEISGWDAATGGAIDMNGTAGADAAKKAPRVIEALPNRNWRADAAMKKKAAAARGEQQNQEFEEPEVKFGLQVFEKKDTEEDASAAAPATVVVEKVDDGLTPEQRLDKQAREALQNGRVEDRAVIPHVHMTEEEAFDNDVREAPDAPSLDAYEATPIEGFGAALLRGMGWKDGEEIGAGSKGKGTVAAKPREVKRRPALLGIGAKPEAAVGEEIGAWSGGPGKGKRRKEEQTYTPVVLRNKHTGEMLTQEELDKKLQAQQLVDDSKEQENKKSERRSKYDDDDEAEERERRRKKKSSSSRYDDNSDDNERDSRRRRDDDRRYKDRRDRDRSSSKRDRDDEGRRRDKRRDRSADEDRERDRRRRDRDYSDDERRREKRRERRDDRSRSPDRDRERERDRDADRKRRRDYDYEDDRHERKRRHRYEEDRKSRK